jgi:chromosome segregation ATPase
MSSNEHPIQSIQFEAPQSTDSESTIFKFEPPTNNRPFSIDLSLELERQLDMEPTSPNAHQNFPRSPQQDRESLDPHILASIIMQLRQSLEEVSKERDGLLNIVSTAHSREAELKDALELMTERATGIEEQLSEARRKMKDDDDAIAMLRTKVEESRYIVPYLIK